ncbi:hypothetical protein ON010_g18957 [Phytophthora cinnamomi]|nr:hypothetical protein ON010_g18957 [Phytophthora cinnamomi]
MLRVSAPLRLQHLRPAALRLHQPRVQDEVRVRHGALRAPAAGARHADPRRQPHRGRRVSPAARQAGAPAADRVPGAAVHAAGSPAHALEVAGRGARRGQGHETQAEDLQEKPWRPRIHLGAVRSGLPEGQAPRTARAGASVCSGDGALPFGLQVPDLESWIPRRLSVGRARQELAGTWAAGWRGWKKYPSGLFTSLCVLFLLMQTSTEREDARYLHPFSLNDKVVPEPEFVLIDTQRDEEMNEELSDGSDAEEEEDASVSEVKVFKLDDDDDDEEMTSGDFKERKVFEVDSDDDSDGDATVKSESVQSDAESKPSVANVSASEEEEEQKLEEDSASKRPTTRGDRKDVQRDSDGSRDAEDDTERNSSVSDSDGDDEADSDDDDEIFNQLE